MLGSTPMMRAALAVALLAATSSAATAGTYVGIGLGTNAASESSDRLVEDGRSGRLILGYRFRPMQFGGALSIEGSFDRYGLGLVDRTSIVGMDANQLSAAVKFNMPLADHFEAFGRLGLQHTSASAANPIYDTSGGGFLIGAGMEYRFNPGVGSGASLTVDYQLNKTTLSGDRFQGESAFGVVERQWTLGVALAF
jgi:hypothetical protein